MPPAARTAWQGPVSSTCPMQVVVEISGASALITSRESGDLEAFDAALVEALAG